MDERYDPTQVEAERLYEPNDTLSPPVAAAVPEAVRCVEVWLAR